MTLTLASTEKTGETMTGNKIQVEMAGKFRSYLGYAFRILNK